jgi:hypothetical protein
MIELGRQVLGNGEMWDEVKELSGKERKGVCEVREVRKCVNLRVEQAEMDEPNQHRGRYVTRKIGQPETMIFRSIGT